MFHDLAVWVGWTRPFTLGPGLRGRHLKKGWVHPEIQKRISPVVGFLGRSRRLPFSPTKAELQWWWLCHQFDDLPRDWSLHPLPQAWHWIGVLLRQCLGTNQFFWLHLKLFNFLRVCQQEMAIVIFFWSFEGLGCEYRRLPVLDKGPGERESSPDQSWRMPSPTFDFSLYCSLSTFKGQPLYWPLSLAISLLLWPLLLWRDSPNFLQPYLRCGGRFASWQFEDKL